MWISRILWYLSERRRDWACDLSYFDCDEHLRSTCPVMLTGAFTSMYRTFQKKFLKHILDLSWILTSIWSSNRIVRAAQEELVETTSVASTFYDACLIALHLSSPDSISITSSLMMHQSPRRTPASDVSSRSSMSSKQLMSAHPWLPMWRENSSEKKMLSTKWRVKSEA